MYSDQYNETVPGPAETIVHRPSLDSVLEAAPKHKTNEILVEKILQASNATDSAIQTKVEALENLDIGIQLANYKICEATHEFKTKIGEMKSERSRLLISIDNSSELSLLINDLDKKISDFENELDEKVKNFNQEKITHQQQVEELMFQLDEDTQLMEDQVQDLKAELNVQMGTMYKAQAALTNQKYAPMLEQLEERLKNYEKLKSAGWRVEQAENRLTEMLEEKGLKVTPSGKLLTGAGSFMTFEEAQQRGFFKEVSLSLDKIFQFFKERDRLQETMDQMGPPDTSTFSEGSTAESKMSSEDVKYLKQYVGKPLALALAEITAKQPRDPIHYLGHCLFKYRYNQELEEIQNREIDELTEQRKMMAQERWKRVVEEEARNAVMEMIMRAEQIAYRNELKRIELEQSKAAEEEEEGYYNQELNALIEEAKDKFE